MSVDRRDLAGTVRQAFGTMSMTCSAHIRSLQSNREAGVQPDRAFVAASVFKVAVALEFYRQVAAGELDPAEPVRTAASERTAGPTGLSLFEDDAVTSLRDLATSMMVVSDNAATDILLERVNIERVNATLASLGIRETYIAYDMAGLLARMIAESGLTTWGDVLRMDPNYDRLQWSTVLRAETTTRTTARDMTTLLCAVWTDAAGTPEACAEVRRLMNKQSSGRLANGLPDARVAAKGGSLLGVVRNEVGVAEFPNGDVYALAVFTRTHRTDFGAGPAIDRAMAVVAGILVAELDGAQGLMQWDLGTTDSP